MLNICDTFRHLEPTLQFEKRENTHGGTLLTVKLQLVCPLVFLNL